MKQLISLSVQRPKAVIAAWLLLLVVAAPFALGLEGALKAGGFANPRGESAHAQHTLEQAFHEAPNSLLVVLHDRAGPVGGAVAQARRAVRRPGVTTVTDERTHPEWVSRDGRTTFLQVGFSGDNTTAQNVVPDLRHDVRAAVGRDVEVDVTGAPALDYALNVHSKEDVTRAELIAFPVLFVVLLLVFRSLTAMAVPLVMAGATLVLTQAIGYGMARATDVNSLFTNIVSMVGLAVAVDYSLFIVKRFREELAAGRDAPAAVERAMRTVGHSVLFSGMAVVVALSALFIPRAMSFTSIALGGATVATVAVTMAMTLLPAVLRLLGHRINAGTLRRRRNTTAAPAAGAAPGTGRIARHPLPVLAALVIGFLALAWPATQLTLRVPVASADILPASDSARIGIERIRQDIGVRQMFPVEVVLTADAGDSPALLTAATDIAGYAGNAPGAAAVQGISTLGLPPGSLPQAPAGGTGPDTAAKPSAGQLAAAGQLWTEVGHTLVTRVLVTPDADPDSAAAHRLVADLRSHLRSSTPPGVTARLAGATAAGADFDSLVTGSIPLVVLTVALLSFLILFLAFRSTVLPLLALAFNVLVVGASLGFLALVAGGTDHTINSVTPPMLFAVMFGLSMDYMVIMIARMREMYLDGMPHRDAVLGGLARTAGLVNGAAAIMIAVFLSFTSAQISIVRELGISLATAVVLDAVVIRRLLMPAALLLVGDRIWGSSRRPAPRETGSTPDPAPAGAPAAGTGLPPAGPDLPSPSPAPAPAPR